MSLRRISGRRGADMLHVNDINVYYGPIHAIKGISFEVCPGEIVALIGANGAGKSTVLQTISGLLRSKTGSIVFDGSDITKTEAHKIVRAGLAHVPEGRRIFLRMTVMENLRWELFHRDLFRKAILKPYLPGSQGLRSDGSRSPGHCQAASSRCWRWDARYEQTEADDAGRTIHGPCTGSGRAGIRNYRRTE